MHVAKMHEIHITVMQVAVHVAKAAEQGGRKRKALSRKMLSDPEKGVRTTLAIPRDLEPGDAWSKRGYPNSRRPGSQINSARCPNSLRRNGWKEG